MDGCCRSSQTRQQEAGCKRKENQYAHVPTDLVSLAVPDVALSSSLLCRDPGSPTQGCCSDGTVLLGGFGGPLNANLTVSSVEYLGPEEEHPSPGTAAVCPQGGVSVKMASQDCLEGEIMRLYMNLFMSSSLVTLENVSKRNIHERHSIKSILLYL